MSKTEIPACGTSDLIIFDFDGVMMDNLVYLFEDDREAVGCTGARGG